MLSLSSRLVMCVQFDVIFYLCRMVTEIGRAFEIMSSSVNLVVKDSFQDITARLSANFNHHEEPANLRAFLHKVYRYAPTLPLLYPVAKIHSRAEIAEL
jgi:hypothetical protein